MFMRIIRQKRHAVGDVLNPDREIPDTGMDRSAPG
jgi:hypothetical protein